METLVPLALAAELQAHSNRRGEKSGEIKMYYRIIDLLKKNGNYSAVLTITQSIHLQTLATNKENHHGD